MRTRILCAIQYDAAPAVTSILSYPCPNTTSDIEFTIILTLLCIFVTKYVTKVELKWLYHTCQKRVLEYQNEDPCLYADATKEVISTFHHCVVRPNQRFYSAFNTMR